MKVLRGSWLVRKCAGWRARACMHAHTCMNKSLEELNDENGMISEPQGCIWTFLCGLNSNVHHCLLQRMEIGTLMVVLRMFYSISQWKSQWKRLCCALILASTVLGQGQLRSLWLVSTIMGFEAGTWAEEPLTFENIFFPFSETIKLLWHVSTCVKKRDYVPGEPVSSCRLATVKLQHHFFFLFNESVLEV